MTRVRSQDGTSRRPLGCFETALQLTGEPAPFNLVIVLRLGGGPTPEVLVNALETLQTHHSLLRVRIVKQADRYFFEPEGTPAIPLRLVDRKNEEDWQLVAEDELNRRLDVAGGPALRCTYLLPAAGDGDREIVLTLNHAVVDAMSSITLLGQLLNLCDPDGAPLGPPDPGLAPPAEELFPARYRDISGQAKLLRFAVRQIVGEAQFRLRSRRSQRPLIQDSARCRLLPRQLSEETTAGLVGSTRRQRVTLNAACSAAMLLAVHRHLYDNSATPMRYFTFADLRPRLHPPAPAAGLGCYISMLRHTASMRPELGFWPLAKAITFQVTTSLRRGDPFCAVRLSPRMMKMILAQRRFRMGTTAISYMGVRRLEPRYGAAVVRGLHAFISSVPFGPQFAAQVRIFDRRLWWDIGYLETDLDPSQAQTIADAIIETLRLASGEE